ncbi:MAG: TonB-dependent receptor [Thermoanaerobaculia bacterium]|nr:TonB-dependent receptor [Thermoanaerobaculia bacterium]MBP9823955.1 TonB-dependent receptor [Thermoanaerobaculia bacterium]
MRPSLVHFAALLGGVTAAASATSALPQTSPPFAESITITATEKPERAAEVPATVEVVTAAEIGIRQAVEAVDLLRTVPGLELVQAGSAGKQTSLFSRGTNSSHTLVLWNGIELNDPYLGGFDWSTLSTDGIERIEVVRGPFSALYGSSALGGVVQLVTRRGGGDDTHLGRAGFEGGSNDYLRGSVAGGHRFGALAVDLAGHLRRGEGEVRNDFYDGEEIDLALEGALSDSATLGALVRRAASDVGIPYDYAGRPTLRREQTFETTSFAVPFAWTKELWHLDAQAATTATDLAVSDPDDPFAASRAEAGRDQARMVVRRSFGDDLEASAGGDWDRQEVRARDAFSPGLSDESQRTWAAFGQLSWTPGPLRVDAGVRRDANDVFGAETSAKAGVVWAISDAWRMRATYGEAFRAPSLADLYYPGFSNPDLSPEDSRSYELAVEGGSGGWRTMVALFENDLDNLIEFDFATFVPQNLGRARARGVEGSLALRRGLVDARLVATWLDAENLDTGGPLLRRPQESASLVVYARPGEWTVGGVLRYVGARTDFGDVALAAYTTLDLSLARRLGGRWEPFLRVENVLDESYDEAAGFPAPGLGFRTGFGLRF